MCSRIRVDRPGNTTTEDRRTVAAALSGAATAVVLALALSACGGAGDGHRPSSSAGAGTGVHAGGVPAADAADRSPAHAPATAGSSAKYGGLPSWLPKPRVHINRLLAASVGHPALSIQGETIAVDLPGGHVLATAAGPEVPEEGRFPVPATSPCTFIVTFASGSGTIPLDPAAFTLVDDLGHVHHPRVTALHGGPLPGSVPREKSVSLKLYDVLPTGDGALEWAPHGGRALVGWDYTVEID